MLCLVADPAGTSESGGDAKLWQDIDLEEDPHNNNGQYNQCFRHYFFLQPTAEMSYAQEKPREDTPHDEDAGEVPVSVAAFLEEKIDSRRSGFDPPHCGHLIGS